MSEAPRFAVVGRVNKGKSSVIATFAEDDRVEISPLPGTTRRCKEYPVRVDGVVLFTLIDTPGFEDAPAALAWLESARPAAHERRQRVEELLRAHEGTDAFREERELLSPILSGAMILYVVDGTKPYRENYASEMEILRWTGQPSMALINRIGDGDHTEAWQSALNQYFKVVRDFDAHSASFEQRVRLLTTFRELAPQAEPALATALEALRADRDRRRSEVARVTVELLIDELGFTMETSESDQTDPRKLEDAFHQALRERERRARREVERLYHHHEVSWEHVAELERPAFGEDLFARRTWNDLGLSAGQVLALYTVAGAVTGSIVDASLGGASVLAGTAIGGALGAGAGVLHLQRRFARATRLDGFAGRLSRTLEGGRRYRVGPFEHPNFPFVLLDRALLHYDAVRTRAHAKNAVESSASLPGEDPRVTNLPRTERQALHRIFQKSRKSQGDITPALRIELRDRVLALLGDGD